MKIKRIITIEIPDEKIEYIKNKIQDKENLLEYFDDWLEGDFYNEWTPEGLVRNIKSFDTIEKI